MSNSKSKVFSAQVLDRDFLKEPIPWQDDEAFDLSLHTGYPQNEKGERVCEVAYAGYRRGRLGRNASAWQRIDNLILNREAVRFERPPKNVIITHWALSPTGQPYPVYIGQFEQPIVPADFVTSKDRMVVDAGKLAIREQ
jgi:hypothetical protein